jgi:hypothetical protein
MAVGGLLRGQVPQRRPERAAVLVERERMEGKFNF